jgi:hypothetical protein
MRYFNIIALLIFILILAKPGIMVAQKFTFEGGILTGLYRVDVRGDKDEFWNDEYKKSGILGLSVGPFVKCNFTPEFYGVLELRYMKKGTTFGYINKYFTQSFETIHFNYLEIPILWGINGVYSATSGLVNYSFESGFAFSKLFSSHLQYDELTRREVTASLTGFRNNDVSWVAQVKLPYRTGKKHNLLVGLRVERSLLSIHKKLKLYNFDYGFELNYLFI